MSAAFQFHLLSTPATFKQHSSNLGATLKQLQAPFSQHVNNMYATLEQHFAKDTLACWPPH